LRVRERGKREKEWRGRVKREKKNGEEERERVTDRQKRHQLIRLTCVWHELIY